jgi:hypothetical protein
MQFLKLGEKMTDEPAELIKKQKITDQLQDRLNELEKKIEDLSRANKIKNEKAEEQVEKLEEKEKQEKKLADLEKTFELQSAKFQKAEEDSYKPMILPKRRVKYDIREISCLNKKGVNRNPRNILKIDRFEYFQ